MRVIYRATWSQLSCIASREAMQLSRDVCNSSRDVTQLSCDVTAVILHCFAWSNADIAQCVQFIAQCYHAMSLRDVSIHHAMWSISCTMLSSPNLKQTAYILEHSKMPKLKYSRVASERHKPSYPSRVSLVFQSLRPSWERSKRYGPQGLKRKTSLCYGPLVHCVSLGFFFAWVSWPHQMTPTIVPRNT